MNQRLYYDCPVLWMKKRAGGSVPVCACICELCGDDIERSAAAVRQAVAEGRGFTCPNCQPKRRRRKTMKNRKNPIPAQKREAADLLISAIAELHGVTIAELMGRCQRPRFVAARREAVQCVKRLELSYPQVGRIFGLDHKTVMYHCGALKRNYPGDFLADKSDMGAIS